ncbi:M20/M25/M40 family metallo-hydrolase [Sphingomonas sp. A2-49]|uniref:M20/M25/M40 family metallo-hydrolase n=1 Tax=Sphingomonas sp. A2-49 TaxID=1391375 RepID=UPI0021D225B4|nr:M20/M25/M40 family metallo-hydrolase [Sphingomonas sp. A2-49]MCU6454294.1 M20/M25/M40 family metallo-hydrolase [Sphingomonas sp. A2-49]
MIPLLFALAMAAPAPALSPAEARMAAVVDAEYERSVALLQRLVDQNSGTMNRAGVTRVGAMIAEPLRALGFTVTWKPLPQTGRAGHVIAVHAGKAGNRRLLLIGHLDTVFEADSPFQRFVRKGDEASGPGAGDDKGGMVVMIAALRAMQAAGTLRDATIEIVLTGDEEDAGDPVAVARADLIAAGQRADVALDFEGLAVEDGRDMGSIARRSVNDWSLSVTGRSGHSSRIFSDAFGDGAANEVARILAAFRTQLPEPNLTFNIGLLAAGATAGIDPGGSKATAQGKSNIIPAQAVASGDFRTLSEEQSRRVRDRMTAIVAAHAPGTTATITFKSGYPAMAPTAGNAALLARLNTVNRDLGLAEMPALDPLKRGAGDISWVAADVPGLVGLGTASRGDHTPDEVVALTSIRRQAKRAAILMSRLAAEPS